MATVEGEGAVPFQPLHIPAAWTAPQALAAVAEWQYELTPTDVEEILAAVKHAVATGKPVPVRLPALAGCRGASAAGRCLQEQHTRPWQRTQCPWWGGALPPSLPCPACRTSRPPTSPCLPLVPGWSASVGMCSMA